MQLRQAARKARKQPAPHSDRQGASVHHRPARIQRVSKVQEAERGAYDPLRESGTYAPVII